MEASNNLLSCGKSSGEAAPNGECPGEELDGEGGVCMGTARF